MRSVYSNGVLTAITANPITEREQHLPCFFRDRTTKMVTSNTTIFRIGARGNRAEITDPSPQSPTEIC